METHEIVGTAILVVMACIVIVIIAIWDAMEYSANNGAMTLACGNDYEPLFGAKAVYEIPCRATHGGVHSFMWVKWRVITGCEHYHGPKFSYGSGKPEDVRPTFKR